MSPEEADLWRTKKEEELDQLIKEGKLNSMCSFLADTWLLVEYNRKKYGDEISFENYLKHLLVLSQAMDKSQKEYIDTKYIDVKSKENKK